MSLPSRPLSIAVFSDSVLPVLNGVSVSIDSLIGSLRDRGHSVTVYTSRFRGHSDPDPNFRRFLSVRSPWTGDYPLAVPPFYAWFREFEQRNFDLVHTHTPFTVGMVGLRWAQTLDLPVVSTYHTRYDKYAHYVPFFPRPYVRYKVAKHTHFYYNSVGLVACPSQPTLRWLRRHSVHTPAEIVPTGIPLPKAIERQAARRELGVGENHCVGLYCGRIAIEKNIEVVLRATAEVVADHPDFRLWLVGDGPARNHYTAMARALQIGDRVRFWGGVPRSEVDQFYAAADVFTFGSMTETQGLVVAEAMSYRLPTVVVGGGGASAAVLEGETGFIVENDALRMADRITTLVRNRDLRGRMGGRAKAHAETMTTSAMADRMLDAYRRLLSLDGRTERKALAL